MCRLPSGVRRRLPTATGWALALLATVAFYAWWHREPIRWWLRLMPCEKSDLLEAGFGPDGRFDGLRAAEVVRDHYLFMKSGRW